jgi:hypothetical protein
VQGTGATGGLSTRARVVLIVAKDMMQGRNCPAAIHGIQSSGTERMASGGSVLRVGRRGTGVEEGFLPGGASEAEASRRAHDSACGLARCRPARRTRTRAARAAVRTGEKERETGGMTGGPGLAVREKRREGPVAGWAAVMGRPDGLRAVVRER